ncbi:MAG: HD domain-containing protein [Promethearchaeota archaeon]
MPLDPEFEEVIRNFSDRSTIRRAQLIASHRVKIFKQDFEAGFIEASIRGSEILPYRITIDLKQKGFHERIHHDCPDFLRRRRVNQEFCKHIIKLFTILWTIDKASTRKILEQLELTRNKEMGSASAMMENDDLNSFIKPSIESRLNFEVKGFDFFFDLIKLDDPSREKIRLILKEARRFPAALGGHHGAYEGGLFDHILLVTNYTYLLYTSMKSSVLKLKKAILAAIYHDFGKISYYSYKRNVKESVVRVKRGDIFETSLFLQQRFGLEGRDYHVEEGISVINKFDLFFDDEMCLGIIFHHGSWSKYRPLKMNELATLIHVADMMASHIHFI